jgi:hypothetical protein
VRPRPAIPARWAAAAGATPGTRDSGRSRARGSGRNSGRGGLGPGLRAGAGVSVLVTAVLLAAGCGGSSGNSPGVPSLGSAPATAGAAGPARSAALHTAAECIRQHGLPHYTDPVLTPDGSVYTDLRSVQDASQAVQDAVRTSCGTLIAQAGFDPQAEPPAPPALVQAGVRSAQCLRAHGLPRVKDPNAHSPYTPGHGFGLSGDEVPAGGKADPTVQAAFRACRGLLDAEIRASTLSDLGGR